MRSRGLEPEARGTALLAERAEGNLLAAQQEIDKLALLVKPGAVDAADRSRRQWPTALASTCSSSPTPCCRAMRRRALRILEGLRAEGVEPTLVLWALSREMRALWTPAHAAMAQVAAHRPRGNVPQCQGLRSLAAAPEPRMPPASRAHSGYRSRAARRSHHQGPAMRGEPWDALVRLVDMARLARRDTSFPDACLSALSPVPYLLALQDEFGQL